MIPRFPRHVIFPNKLQYTTYASDWRFYLIKPLGQNLFTRVKMDQSVEHKHAKNLLVGKNENTAS